MKTQPKNKRKTSIKISKSNINGIIITIKKNKAIPMNINHNFINGQVKSLKL